MDKKSEQTDIKQTDIEQTDIKRPVSEDERADIQEPCHGDNSEEFMFIVDSSPALNCGGEGLVEYGENIRHQDTAQTQVKRPVPEEDETEIKELCYAENNRESRAVVDSFPAPKETRKLFSSINARLCSFVHNCNWEGLSKYGEYLRHKHSANNIKSEAYYILHKVYLIDTNCVRQRYDKAMQICKSLERSLARGDINCEESILVRFLTTKATMYDSLGNKEEARRIAEGVVNMCRLQATNWAHGYAFGVFGKLVLLNDRDGILESDSKHKSEQMLRRCFESNRTAAADLEEDHKLPEATIKYFGIWSRMYYSFAILGANSSDADSWISSFRTSSVNYDELRDAALCLASLTQDEAYLTPRQKLDCCLAKCDYFLREWQLKQNYNLLEKANEYLSSSKQIYSDFEPNFVRGEHKNIMAREKLLSSCQEVSTT